MKKEQNAEKTKVRKLARTKEKVSQWTTNPLNEKVLDYHNYEMTKSESVLYFVAAFLVGGVVSQFFYGGLFQEDGVPTLLTYISNSAAFVIVGLLVGKVFLPVRSRQLAEKRRDTLRRQFRDMLESLTASLAANSTVRDAFSSAYTDMCMQYSDDALISKELDQFRRAEQINVTLDVMMDDFAKRSGVEEIQDFNNVFQVCYGPGGNMSRVINQTHDIICERMEVEDEIQAKHCMMPTSPPVRNIMRTVPRRMSAASKKMPMRRLWQSIRLGQTTGRLMCSSIMRTAITTRW